MNKFKLFIDNFLVYGLGSVIAKIIPLVMLPIITRLIPDPAFYGLFDLSNTIISFGTSIAILGMYDAMFRYFFEKKDVAYRRDICSTTLMFTVCTSVVVFLLMVIFCEELAEYVFSDTQYGILVYLTAIATLIGATNGIISAPTRMQNQRKIFLITNTISPILGYAVSIPLLLQGYYLIALPLAGIISSAVIELAFAWLNRSFFSIHGFRMEYLRQLLVIALPLAPTFFVYWIFNSSDRLMITKLIGVEATGIYSIGSKLGLASQLIYQAFAGGWQYFAFSTMNEANQVKSNSLVFEYLGLVSFISCMFICAICKVFYEILFTGDYVQGYIVSPYLFLAPLLLMLYQVASNQLLVIKKTLPGALILFIGALSNVGLNFLLIPTMGVEGAGLATLLGYVISVVLVVILLTYMDLIDVSRRFYTASLVMATFFFVWRTMLLGHFVYELLFSVLGSVLLTSFYWSDIRGFVQARRKNR